MNPEQVRHTLKYIEDALNDEVKEQIFSRLGQACFHTRKLDDWVGQFQNNVQAFLDRVNVENASKYWGRLAFNQDGNILTLTGRKVEWCACAFADCPHPPLSLCRHCCKSFQQELIGTLFGRQVEVEITEAYLLGDERCSTRIHLL